MQKIVIGKALEFALGRVLPVFLGAAGAVVVSQYPELHSAFCTAVP